MKMNGYKFRRICNDKGRIDSNMKQAEYIAVNCCVIEDTAFY